MLTPSRYNDHVSLVHAILGIRASPYLCRWRMDSQGRMDREPS